MRIAEIYASLQGEGLLAGTPCTFVRTSGCNLRCHWCDTPFTSWEPTGDVHDVATIARTVARLGRRHVVVTGGEPLLATGITALCRMLRQDGLHVTIETAGTVASDAPADLMSISPKLSSSGPPADTASGWASRHATTRRRDDVIQSLMDAAEHQLKFVIDSPADVAETTRWLDDLEDARPAGIDPGRVFLMPQGRTPAELAATTRWLAAECRLRGFHLGHRHHITWFGNRRGT